MRKLVVQPVDDDGFTLIELLVVMIIIGILAAIAIPTFLNQRAKARDAATTSDVSRLGKEVAAYFVDGTGTVSLDTTTKPGVVIVKDNAATQYTAEVQLTGGTRPATTPLTGGSTGTTWCVALTNPQGSKKDYKFTAAAGLSAGTC